MRTVLRPVSVLLLIAMMTACGANARTKALQTNLVFLNAARDTVLEVSRTRERQIVDQATSKEEGRAQLDAWRAQVDPVVESLAKGYRLLAAAALLEDAKSANEAIAAVLNAIALAKELK